MTVPVHKHGLKLGWNMVFLKQKKWDLNGFGGVQPAEEQGIQPLNQMLDKKTKMDETLVYSTTFKELQVSKKTPLICSRMRDSCVKCFPHYRLLPRTIGQRISGYPKRFRLLLYLQMRIAQY